MKRFFVFFILVLLFLPACKIRDFALPVWDVDIAIPLINQKYFVSDLLDSVYIVSDQNDLVHLKSNGTLQSEEIFAVSAYPNLDQVVPVASGISVELPVPLSDTQGDVSLSYGRVKSGTLRYQFKNINPATSQIKLIIQDFKHPDGSAFEIVYEDMALHTIDLNGISIGEYNSGALLENLTVQIQSQSSLPQGSPLGEVQVQMLDELKFSLFQGYLRSFEIQAATGDTGIDVEYPFGLENAITLQEASIQIDITNQLHFSCKFSGSLRASREGREVLIPIVDDSGNAYIIPPATDTDFGYKTLTLHNNISQLLQIMPTHIDIVNPKFTIDTESGFGSLQDDQRISASYRVDAPFSFELHEYPIEIAEVLDVSMPEGNRDTIRKNLMNAQLEILLLNKLPIGGRAYAYFGTQEDMDIQDPSTYSFVKSIQIQSNTQNPDWQSIPELRLNRDELLLFAEEKVFLKWVFSFEPTDGAVEIHASTADYIGIKGSFKGKIRVEE